MLKNWNELPEYMRVDEVRPYYDLLQRKKLSLFFKRIFDIVVSLIMIILCSPILLIISILIVKDSKGVFSIDRKESLNMAESLESLSLEQWFKMLIRLEHR